MNRVNINVSGASGSGSSLTIYETPGGQHPQHGTRVTHGSRTSPDEQRIEIVELCLPGLNIRVGANDVRAELQALLAANKAANEAWQVADGSADLQPARHQAFVDLQRAVFSLAAREITVEHIERIVTHAYTDGLRDGVESMRSKFRALLGL